MRSPTIPLQLVFLLVGFLLVGVSSQAHAQPAASASANVIAPAGSAPTAASARPPGPASSVPTPVNGSDGGSSDAAPPDASVDASASAAPVSGPSRTRDYGLNLGLGEAPPTVHRDTPRACLQGFLAAARQRDYESAAHYIHLWGIPAGRQKQEGPILANRLADALDRAVWIDLDQVPDTSTGSDVEGAKPRDDVKIATVDLENSSHAIRLARVRDPFAGKMVWVFAASTVQSIDALDEVYGLPPYVEKLPAWTRDYKVLGLVAFQWAGLLVLGLLSWLCGRLLELPVLWLVRRAVRRTDPAREELAVALTRGPMHWLVGLMLMLASVPVLRLSATASLQFGRVLVTGIIIVVTVGALRFVRISVEGFRDLHANGADDNLRMRSLRTRLDAVRRIAQVLVIIVGIALALMQFPTARTVGLSLLGSAGIAGAILGFAAQKTFANLFAGILISFTQPIRIGDTVIVEKEYGVIETIGSTHVVVRIWDSRRLVVPVTYFLDKPFENWTKVSPYLWGTVILHVDYRVDVDDVRAELDRVLQDEPLFNGDAKKVLVLDMTEQSAVLRVTVSADDASKLWDLRCKVREALLAYLQNEPWRLPRHRVEGPGAPPVAV